MFVTLVLKLVSTYLTRVYRVRSIVSRLSVFILTPSLVTIENNCVSSRLDPRNFLVLLIIDQLSNRLIKNISVSYPFITNLRGSLWENKTNKTISNINFSIVLRLYIVLSGLSRWIPFYVYKFIYWIEEIRKHEDQKLSKKF